MGGEMREEKTEEWKVYLASDVYDYLTKTFRLRCETV